MFFFSDPATTEIYTYGHTLSLHDALPIFRFGVVHALPSPHARRSRGDARRGRRVVDRRSVRRCARRGAAVRADRRPARPCERTGGGTPYGGAVAEEPDRKSTRLNSSH